MWRLNTPNIEITDRELLTALTLVNGNPVYPISDNQRQRIRELYQEYDNNSGNPHDNLKGEDIVLDLRQAIHDAYGSQVQIRGRLEDYRDKIKLNAECCPYCGFGAITDLDHHLPRSTYKAHAIYARNLIPSCSACNNLKRAKAGDTPDTQFSHVYFGQVPQEVFLVASATANISGLVVTYSIQKTPNLNVDEFQRLKYQFSALNLNDRYVSQVNIHIGSLRTSIELMAVHGENALRSYLQQCYEQSRQDFGMNHWRSALLKALTESDEFCQGAYRFCFGRKDMAV
ncbi:HNH endonuclease signature motif containing protein [Pseudomonas saxonica]|uniref:HNH endonuclease signature motif containing protein n=1 Tax=Pseudomonas saxonica TaxID=2600598 RepID=UPI002D790376|nr:HNH endonuclease signature motif containing protein [Pseudomonas saxonica]WRQ75070.1 HNH endonuclease signature motif containing protein [Pseudomonas saxonica]